MTISPEEFQCIRQFLHDHSGILINEGKEYLALIIVSATDTDYRDSERGAIKVKKV